MRQVVKEGNMSTWQFFFPRVHQRPQGEIERGRKEKVDPPALVTDERGGVDERHFPHVLECLLAQHRPWQEGKKTWMSVSDNKDGLREQKKKRDERKRAKESSGAVCHRLSLGSLLKMRYVCLSCSL